MGFDFDRSEVDPDMPLEDSPRGPFPSDRPHTALSVLHEALATDLVYVLRCRQHYAVGESLTKAVKNEFLINAQNAEKHAEQIARRIVQLGGQPRFNPATVASRAEELSGMMEILDDLMQDPLGA